MVLVSLIGSRSVALNWGITDLAGIRARTEPANTIGTVPIPTQAGNFPSQGTTGQNTTNRVPSFVLPNPDPWNGRGRVTILVMGLDYADWESSDRAGPPRSDTMILLTVDPVSQTAGMLSIPRDLWVTMPGIEGYHKINTAHRFGELYKMPGGGPGLAMRTVERLIGVPINFYARIDFYAFEDFIDELGGIEVDVPEEIKVDPIGPGNTVVLEPGRQLLDGPTALAYARNRDADDGDFDRARRQQQVLFAIRDRVLNLDRLPLLIYKAPLLYGKLSQGIQTNMTLEQAIKLAWLAMAVPQENIQRAVIGNHEVIYDKAPDGQAIFVPIPERIRALRDEIFPSSILGLSQGMTTGELIAAENTRIRIVNETGDEALGELTAKYLNGLGLNVIQTVQSDKSRAKTRLVDHVDNPYTLRYLIDLLHVAPSEIYIQFDLEAGTDLVVYLGADWASDNPLQQ
jgi:LCP family protein required for cell wall assembly